VSGVHAEKAADPASKLEKAPATARSAGTAAAVPAISSPAGLTPESVLVLQRLVGNGGVGTLLAQLGERPARTLTRQLTVQRQAPPDKDTTKLDPLIGQVSAECDAFGTFKQSPLDGNAIPGRNPSIQRAVSRWDGGPVEPWMRDYVREKMGPLRLKLLNEMISISGVGWPDYETLFDVGYQDPMHKYTLELKAAGSFVEKQIAKLAPTVTIHYTNAFGWAWQRDYRLAGFELSAGASAELKGKKVKPKGGMSAGPVTLDISGSATATPVPLRYCGGENFTGGFTVVKASTKAHLGPAGGTLGTLTAISFEGTPAGEVSFPFTTPISGSVSGSSTKSGVDVSIGGGGGLSIGQGETQVTPPPVLEEQTQLSRSFREWEAVIGPFDTEKVDVTPEAAGYLDQLKKTVYDFKTQKLDPMAGDLRTQSIDPDKNFQLTFDLVGMASRSWSSAPSNAERLRRNQDLSLRRAAAVETEVYNRFPDAREVKKEGAGSHAMGPTPEGGGTAPMLDDTQAQALYEEKKREAMAEPDPEVRRMMLQAVEANYGPGSDQQAARRVYVFCRWEGMMIMKVLVPVVSTPAP
jgi:hypothetical protein